MKKIYCLIIGILFITNSLKAQTPLNSLDFDGVDDYVTTALPTVFNDIPNNDFTIEAWIKPTGAIFSRIVFAQFNSSNFATLSVSGTNTIYFYVSNVASATTSSSLPVGVWSHVACTWDASTSYIDIYINGILQSTVAGGSSSTGSDNSMTIGARTNAAQFFPGELDEVRIWDDIRTPCEIVAGMSSEYTVAQTNLVAYYNFNQGTAGGTNTGITALPDFTTNYNGTLLNFGLTGATSNWAASAAGITTVNFTNGAFGIDTQTACQSFDWIDGNTYTSNNSSATHTFIGGAVNGCDSLVTLNLTILSPVTGTDVRTECNSYTWIDNITYTTDNNTATHTIIAGAVNGCDSIVTLNLTVLSPSTGTDTRTECNAYTWMDGNSYTSNNNTAIYTIVGGAINGCDSIVTLDLTINSVSDITTSTSGVTISANNSAATYQWVDCSNNQSIVGATGQSYVALVNGNYAVEITENGCVDTSACITINSVGILENDFGNALSVYPNPTTGKFIIDLGEQINSVNVHLTDLNGRIIQSQEFNNAQLLHMKLAESPGIYLLIIESTKSKTIIRLTKE